MQQVSEVWRGEKGKFDAIGCEGTHFFHQKRCSWTNTIHTSPMEGMGMIKGLFRERMCQLGVAMFELMNPISFLLGHSSSEILVLAHFLQRSYEAAGLLEKESLVESWYYIFIQPPDQKGFSSR